MTNAIRAQGTYIQRGAGSAVTPQTISTITSVGLLATVTTAIAHGLTAGAIVTLSNQIPGAYAGVYAVNITSPTVFTLTTAVAAGGPATTVGTYTAQNFVFAELEEASGIKLGGVTISSIDCTHLRSAAKEFIPGLSDNTTVDLTCNFVNGSVQNLIRTDANAGATSAYRIVVNSSIPGAPSTTTISFQGFAMKYAGPEAKVDGKLEIQISLKVTGALAFVTA